MSWQSVSFGDCIEVVSGAAFKSASFTENPEDVPLIKGENIGQGEILWNKSRYWPAAQFAEYSKFALEPDDIVLAMDRPWVTAGLKFAIISERDPPSLLVQRVARIRPLSNASARYLKHIVGSRAFLEYIKGIMGGTNVPHISGGQIKAFRCQLPDLETQSRIAAILSAYDDLIENNRRRIGLLEAAARQLYKEWFVRFRFPGHEHINIIDGVPEGWERCAFRDVGTVRKGKNITKETVTDGPVPVVAGGLTPAYFHNASNVSHSAVTISASGANAGYVNYYQSDIWASDCSYLSAGENENLRYFYLLLVDRQPDLTAMQKGAAQPHVYPKDVERLDVFRVPKQLTDLFKQSIDPMFDQIANLSKQIEQLAKARDLLLPRLMSGAIAV